MSETAFTEPGKYRWVCPEGVTSVEVELQGGTSGDGEPGEIRRQTVEVTPGRTYEIEVGADGRSAAVATADCQVLGGRAIIRPV